MGSSYGIGLSGLFASKYALMISNQNIANAENPNYTRRVVNFQEMDNNGVKVLNVRRMFDEVVNKSLLHSTSNYASANAYSQQFKSFEPQLDNETTNIGVYLQQSVNELNHLNISASSIQSRNQYCTQLSMTADRFNQLSTQIRSDEQSLRSAIQAKVSNINEITQKIAEYNEHIDKAEKSCTATENLPLLDERDRLMRDLSELMNFNSVTDERGMVSIQLPNGSALVNKYDSVNLMPYASSKIPGMLDIAINRSGTPEVITQFVTGGEIAGLMSFQEDGLRAAARGIDRLALAIAISMNAQHKLGMDLNGNIGGNIFNDMNTSDLEKNRVFPSSNNVSNKQLSVTIDDISALTVSDYRLTFTSATEADLVRISDGAVVASGNVASWSVNNEYPVDGFSINFEPGAASPGDSFFISPTFGAASALRVKLPNSSSLALAHPIATQPSIANLGSGEIRVDSVRDTSTSAFATPGKLSPPVTVKFISSTQFSLIDSESGHVLEPNIAYVSGNPIFPTPNGYDPGYRVSIEGEVRVDDEFLITLNHAGHENNGNGLALADIYQQSQLDGGQLNFIQGYYSVSNDISAKTGIAKFMETTQSIIKTQATLRRDQLSGVSLEEEAINVARFQQSYQASAQVLSTITNMFDVVMNLLRR
jgi:flagellar hook-associated protein 1 FlgK